MSSAFDRAASEASVLLVGQPDNAAVPLSAGGLTVRRADDAAECSRLVHEHVPAVIVIDRILPDGDGWELVGRLRALLPSLAGTKFIALTSDISRGSVERAAAVGCEVFLGKPCEPEVLLSEVRRILARKRASR